MPLRDGLTFVHNALTGINKREHIKIGASGKVTSAFDLARAIALGADWCNSARGFMFALGCIQSLSCHTDRCPTGVTSQDPIRNRALVVPHKADRVYNYHHATLHALAELLAAAGLEHPRDLRPIHFSQRMSTTDVCSFARLYPALRPGELLGVCQGLRVVAFEDGYLDAPPRFMQRIAAVRESSSGAGAVPSSAPVIEKEAVLRPSSPPAAVERSAGRQAE